MKIKSNGKEFEFAHVGRTKAGAAMFAVELDGLNHVDLEKFGRKLWDGISDEIKGIMKRPKEGYKSDGGDYELDEVSIIVGEHWVLTDPIIIPGTCFVIPAAAGIVVGESYLCDMVTIGFEIA